MSRDLFSKRNIGAIKNMNDPIVDEVRKFRMEHTKQFNGDLKAIFEDLVKQQEASGRTFVRRPPRLIQSRKHDLPKQ